MLFRIVVKHEVQELLHLHKQKGLRVVLFRIVVKLNQRDNINMARLRVVLFRIVVKL